MSLRSNWGSNAVMVVAGELSRCETMRWQQRSRHIVKNLPGTASQLDDEMRKQVEDLPDTLMKLPVLK